MISDLLDVSKLESGVALSLRRTPFDLAALCERLLEEHRYSLNPKPPITLVFEAATRPLEFSGDSDRMEQILINLLSNAVKYSPDGGIITLFLAQNDNEVCLEVRDQGMGMTPEQQQNLFQKFYRTADAKARGIKGTGLGLNLVKQLVEAHHGRVEVESVREKGTTFRVVLPTAGQLG